MHTEMHSIYKLIRISLFGIHGLMAIFNDSVGNKKLKRSKTGFFDFCS